jgi:copper chaperone CopZ
MKAKHAGILSAILGSICCIGPLLLVALGLGTGAALIGRYHLLFVAAAIGVLAWAWIKYFRENARCACEHRAMNSRGLSLLTLLIASAIVLGFAALNISSYVFAETPPAPKALGTAALQRAVIPVGGMSCATCEIAVRHAIKRIDGVKSAHVSVATKTATVDYEAAKTNPKQLVAAINSTGYRATLPNEVKDSAAMARNKNTNDPKTELASASGTENSAATTADRISVFKAPLVCPAAPHIGCGSASKLILLDLERQPAVREAWLNRAGTTIAVVWEPESNAETRGNVAAELKEDHATELQGESRDDAVKDFLSGTGWYRGADVDRLSEEEAGIIAARFVRRVQAKTALAKDKAEELERALTDAIRGQLTGQCSAPDQKQQSIQDVAGQYLNQEQLKILKEACEKGPRPLPGES